MTKPKRWRAEAGKTFWYVNDYGRTIEVYSYADNDDQLYNYGNYFKTKKQALEAAKKIRKVLRGERQ